MLMLDPTWVWNQRLFYLSHCYLESLCPIFLIHTIPTRLPGLAALPQIKLRNMTDLRKGVGWCQQHVFRFQVTVDNVLEVKVSQSHQDLRGGDGAGKKGRKIPAPDSAASPPNSIHALLCTPKDIPQGQGMHWSPKTMTPEIGVG